METQSKKGLKQSELAEELLLVENSLLYTQLKLRYFPCDYVQDLTALAERRARIVAMLEGSSAGQDGAAGLTEAPGHLLELQGGALRGGAD